MRFALVVGFLVLIPGRTTSTVQSDSSCLGLIASDYGALVGGVFWPFMMTFERTDETDLARYNWSSSFPEYYINKNALEGIPGFVANGSDYCSPYFRGLVFLLIIHELLHNCLDVKGSAGGDPGCQGLNSNGTCEEFLIDYNVAEATCRRMECLQCKANNTDDDEEREELEEEIEGLKAAQQMLKDKYEPGDDEENPYDNAAEDCSAEHGGETCDECTIGGAPLSMPTSDEIAANIAAGGSPIPCCDTDNPNCDDCEEIGVTED